MADPASRSRVPIGLLLTALALALMSWPYLSLEPDVGLDPSWRTGLHMAFEQGLDAGTQVLFSYGPLGFLRVPQYAFADTTRLAFAYTFVVQLALCLALLWALRRNFGSLLVAAPIALVIASLCDQEPVLVLVFVVAVEIARSRPGRPPAPWLLAATGALVGVQLLGKLNTGVGTGILCAIALLALRERRGRSLAWFAGGLVVALAGGWAFSGQPIGAIGPYVRGSLQIISGYSEAMGLDEPGRDWEPWAALALTIVGLGLVARGDRLGPDRGRLAMAVLWLALAYLGFKAGFVRHDGGHANIFFATMLGGLAALPLVDVPRATSALALLLAATALFASYRIDPDVVVAPIQRARAFLDQSRTVASGAKLNAAIVAARARLQQAYQLDPRIFAALRGHPAHVDPYDLNVLWAYQLPWRPIPVFQSYSAYTHDLDELNAAALRSADGPERVLRRAAPAVDGRVSAWESPAAMRALLCTFRPVQTTAAWQVLERVANRCGPSRLLSETRAHFGAPIVVPRSPGAAHRRIHGAGRRPGHRCRAALEHDLPSGAARDPVQRHRDRAAGSRHGGRWA